MRFAACLFAIAYALQTPTSLGSFTIAGQTFTVARNENQLQIRDQSNAVQYQKTISPDASVTAKLVAESGFAALLLHYVRSGGESWQLFRLKEGKLAILDAPVVAGPSGPFIANGVITGALLRGAVGSTTRLNATDTVELSAWGGNFYLTVPLRVDWQQGRTAPGQQCFEMAGGPGLAETGCEMRVEAVRKPGNEEFTFVRLFNGPTENLGLARHVVIQKDAKIEYLGAKAIVKWKKSDDEFSAELDDIWLKVLIDDNEDNLGWVHTEEEFAAVGLPRGKALP